MNISFTIRGTTVLRLGLSMVFLWFGLQQFVSPESWIGFIPEAILKLSPVGPVTLVHMNGAIELVFGTAMILGLFTRISALILALHMAHITFLVGYDSIGVRDFGLAVATFAIFLNGADNLTLDQFLFFSKQDLNNIENPPMPKPPEKIKYVPGEFHY